MAEYTWFDSPPTSTTGSMLKVTAGDDTQFQNVAVANFGFPTVEDSQKSNHNRREILYKFIYMPIVFQE